MVDYSGSGGIVEPYKFTNQQKEGIRSVSENYCSSDNFDDFISIIEKGIEYYLFARNNSVPITTSDLLDQVKEIQNTFRKLSNQLGKLHCTNESLIDQYYYLKERHFLRSVNERGSHFYGWGDSMQSLMIDLDIACSDYLDDLKPSRGQPGWRAELNLVETILNAIKKHCPTLNKESKRKTAAIKLVDYLITILDIRSKHNKKSKDRIKKDKFYTPPTATGKAIVNAWYNEQQKIIKHRNQ